VIQPTISLEMPVPNQGPPSNLPKGKTELISQKTDTVSQQPENEENRNGPDLVQAFPKKWWVESHFTASNLPLPLRLKGFGCHYNSIFNNTGTNEDVSVINIHFYFCKMAFIWCHSS
jgi:hypothetical protein